MHPVYTDGYGPDGLVHPSLAPDYHNEVHILNAAHLEEYVLEIVREMPAMGLDAYSKEHAYTASMIFNAIVQHFNVLFDEDINLFSVANTYAHSLSQIVDLVQLKWFSHVVPQDMSLTTRLTMLVQLIYRDIWSATRAHIPTAGEKSIYFKYVGRGAIAAVLTYYVGEKSPNQ